MILRPRKKSGRAPKKQVHILITLIMIIVANSWVVIYGEGTTPQKDSIDVRYITWQDLIDDFEGNYSLGKFRNGTFKSYDECDVILIKDEIKSIKSFSWSIYGERTHIKFTSTNNSEWYDIELFGILNDTVETPFNQGDEVIIRLQVYAWMEWINITKWEFVVYETFIEFEPDEAIANWGATPVGFYSANCINHAPRDDKENDIIAFNRGAGILVVVIVCIVGLGFLHKRKGKSHI